MVRFRKVVAGTPTSHWWDDGANGIAFSRGALGFVALNGNAAQLQQTLQTGLPPGTYCDRLTGGRVGGACAGTALVVDQAGMVQVDLAPGTAVAGDTATAH
jgi:alpha-amylase